MEKRDLVGYRFHPTGEELINYYLKNKIHGKTRLVHEAIREINICDYEPFLLPSLSKIHSDDLTWYFVSPKEYNSTKKKVIKRTTRDGYWKVTGVDRHIKDIRGDRSEIGIKKTLVFYQGRTPNGVRTPWVMHEYHITSLPIHQRNYVICQVMYKGEDEDIPFPSAATNNSNEPSHSVLSDLNTARAVISTPPEVEQPGGENWTNGLSMNDLSNPINQQENHPSWYPNMNNVQLQAPNLAAQDDDMLWDAFNENTWLTDDNSNLQPQTPYFPQDDNEFLSGLKHVNRGQVEHLFSDEDEFMMQQHYNNYRPKQSVSTIIADYGTDSDNDAESISETSYQGTSSPGEKVGSPDKSFLNAIEDTPSTYYSRKDVQASTKPSKSRKARESQLTRPAVPSKQEVIQGRSKAVDAFIKSSMVKVEKKGLFIMEEAMKKGPKYPRYMYLMNAIIGFILLLALIDNIISVLLPVKT